MIYYALGDALITNEELFTANNYDKVAKFTSDIQTKKSPDSIKFSTGTLNVENSNKPVDFKDIGLGQPLTVMLREVYTGKYPKGNLFGGKKDMLLTSAIKSITSFEAKPKAINYLLDNVKSNSNIERPSPSKEGTPFIFYSPALLDRSLTMELNIVFDNFPQEVFDQVSSFLTSAGAIPAFLAQSVYLIGAGIIVKLLGSGGEAIFDGSPIFTSNDAIDIFLPGKPPIPAGFVLVTSDNVDQIDATFRQKYKVNEKGQVVDSGGNSYKGDIPYAVISLDGTKDEKLSDFAPTAASAAILSRFFGIKNKQEQSLDIILSALKLYNDLKFRKEVDQLDEQIKKTTDEAEKAELDKKRKALEKNILEEILKPKS